MPLKKGKGSVPANMKELLKTFKETGKIGNTTPKDKKHAARIASAIAYKKKREG